MSIEEFVSSNGYVSKKANSEIIYPHPSNVVEAFRQSLGGNTINVLCDKPVSIHIDNEVQTAYTNYLLTSEVPGYDIKGHKGQIGVIVDIPKNKMVIYSGFEATACANLCTFGATSKVTLDVINLHQMSEGLYKVSSHIAEQAEVFNATVERLMNVRYSNDIDMFRRLGEFTSVNNAPWGFIKHASEQLLDETSIYYDWENSDWKILSAMTDNVKNKRVTSQIALTKQLESLFV
jgi:hypothetical protein